MPGESYRRWLRCVYVWRLLMANWLPELFLCMLVWFCSVSEWLASCMVINFDFSQVFPSPPQWETMPISVTMLISLPVSSKIRRTGTWMVVIISCFRLSKQMSYIYMTHIYKINMMEETPCTSKLNDSECVFCSFLFCSLHDVHLPNTQQSATILLCL